MNKLIKNKVIILFASILIGIICIGYFNIKIKIAESHNKKFISYFLENKDSLALVHINKALDLDAKNSLYWANKGILLMKIVDFDLNNFLKDSTVDIPKETLEKSLSCFERASLLNPYDAAYFHNTGWIYIMMGDTAKALSFINKALKLDPGSSLYHISRGLLFEKQNNLEYAISNYSIALQNSPDMLESEFFSDLIIRQPLFSDTIINKSLKYLSNEVKNSNSPILKARLGKLYLYKNKIDKAEPFFIEVTKILPNLNRPWYYLGVIQEMKGDTFNFKISYNRATMLDPTDYLPNLSLGNYYYKFETQSSLPYYKNAVRAWAMLYSEHFFRGKYVYNSKMINNDIIPKELLQYIKPKFDYKFYCQRISDIYGNLGDTNNSNFYHNLYTGRIFLSTLLNEKKIQ